MAHRIDIYVGRQPIFNKKLKVIAYELLFRANTEDNKAVIVGGDVASAKVMMNTLAELGLSEVVGPHQRAFINFTEALLLKEFQPFYPQSKVVVEVLEDIEITPKLIQSLHQLKKQGYTIALDDYLCHPDYQILEQYADIIKIDILSIDFETLPKHIERIKAKGIYLLAEKVETNEQYEMCAELGFDYFQGYFFAKPNTVTGKRLPNNKLTLLELLVKVYEPDINISVLTKLISNNVALSQKLLTFISESNFCKMPIVSIHDAILRFGLNRLQSWTCMLVLSGVENKPTELLITSIIRAKFCELLSDKLGGFSKDVYFTVGLFSCLDTVMDCDLKILVNKLGLADSLKDAVLSKEGLLGSALHMVERLEAGDTHFDIPEGLCPTELSQHYLHAMHYAKGVKL